MNSLNLERVTPICTYINKILKKGLYIHFITLLLLSACGSDKNKTGVSSEKAITVSSFVGSKTCVACHQEEYSNWKGSHHEQAMKIADSTSILGDFNDVTFMSKGINYTFFKKGKEHFVNTEGVDGKYHDYKISYTFGVTPLQQYLIAFPEGKFQCLLVAWNVTEYKWYDLQPSLEIHQEEWMHWTGGSMTWNTMCADCHSTNLQKNFESKTGIYQTTFSEINVSCEACHGPSSEHVNFYKNPRGGAPPKMYMDTSMTSVELVQKCARCHSRRGQLTKRFDYNGHFLDHYNPSLLVEPVYELDGQIKDEDYVYGSFVQSKMYHEGVSCKDCHDVHSLKLKKTGSALCLNCHDAKYDEPSHHFHEANTSGAQCINCHMTSKVYMGSDVRRDHSFRVPRPDQSVKYGTPNACNTCHQDKNAQWASDVIVSKFGDTRVAHFSDYLLAGSQGDIAAYYELLTQKKHPEISRATALNRIADRQITQEEVAVILRYLNDASALVRNEAMLALQSINSNEFSNYIKPLLLDSVRLVRISAARYFNMKGTPLANNTDFDKAQKEYLERLEMNADFPSGQYQIAMHHQANGAMDKAIKAYKRAIEIDNYHNISRMNLALLLYNQGNVSDAETLYLKVAEQEPNYSYPNYMLGLLYNEEENTDKSLKHLSAACEKEPIIINAFYNYALKLQENGLGKKANDIIDRALQTEPHNERLLYAKLVNQINDNQDDAAYNTCMKLLEVAPNNVNYKQILERLKGK